MADFGSADNTETFTKSLDETQRDEGAGPGGTRQLRCSPMFGSDDDCSDTADHARASGTALLHEIQDLKDNLGHLEDCLENVKVYYQQNYTVITETLLEQQYR